VPKNADFLINSHYFMAYSHKFPLYLGGDKFLSTLAMYIYKNNNQARFYICRQNKN